MSRVLRFVENTFVAAHDPLEPGASPALADSFLCIKGRVRGFSLHRRRCERDLSLIAPQLLPQLDAFFAAVSRELADEPEVFPRIDVVDESLWLRVRPVPELTESVTAVSQQDQPTNARVKGPNIAHYAELNARNGAETLRIDAEGNVLEGVTSAILWWDSANLRQADATLHVVAAIDRVWSTTEDLVCDIAHQRFVGLSPDGKVEPRLVDLKTLQRCEVWLVNALQGIRTVTSIDGKTLPPPDTERLQLFRSALNTMWEPLAS